MPAIDRIMSIQNWYGETLTPTPTVMVFGDGTSKR
jgi:hypothetical protein